MTTTDASITLTVNGSDFVSGAIVRWNSDTQLIMTIASADFLGGSAVVTVANPAPGGGRSNELLYVLSRVSLPFVLR